MPTSLKSLKTKLQDVVDKMHVKDKEGLDLTPMYPWVLVRVLPKSQYRGVLVLPEKQNKVNYEGIVLRTWQPFEKHYEAPVPKELQEMLSKLIPIEDVPKRINGAIKVVCEVKAGDHVIFPHYAGYPAGRLEEKEYRVVKCGQFGDEGGITMTLGHISQEDMMEEIEEQTIVPVLKELGLRTRKTGKTTILQKIFERYDVLPKNNESQTLSGV